jgi:hypothetical protein
MLEHVVHRAGDVVSTQWKERSDGGVAIRRKGVGWLVSGTAALAVVMVDFSGG